jgi:hypothetical protein
MLRYIKAINKSTIYRFKKFSLEFNGRFYLYTIS